MTIDPYIHGQLVLVTLTQWHSRRKSDLTTQGGGVYFANLHVKLRLAIFE